MKQLLSIILLAAMATSTFAATKVFYCDPAATNENAKGSSWEDAVTLSMLRKSLNGKGMKGSTVYIKGGTIKFSQISDFWTIKTSVTLVGGFDPAATGTSTELPTYPSPTPTVFNGDINNDGVPSKGDAKALMRVDYSDDSTLVVTLEGFDFINTYYEDEESPNDELTAMNDCAALRLIRGTAFVKHCHFYNHITPNNRGSQCVTVVGARLHMSDCELHDCASLTRGGLLRMRNFFIGNDPEQPREPDCVLERCSFYSGNSMGGKSQDITGLYAGGVHASYGPIFAINCTFANNVGYTDGGGVSANISGASFISCSFFNNYCARADNMDLDQTARNAYGSSFHIANNAPIRLANTFVLDDMDNASKRYAPFYSDANNVPVEAILTSGGYNVLGTVWCYKGSQVPDQSNVWKASDIWTAPNSSKAENYTTYFGSDKAMQKNGGFSKTILPLEMQPGDNVAHLQQLADQWCPSWTKVDASLDQRGLVRDANETCVGAAAFEAEGPSAIETLSQPNMISGQLYNILGQPVPADYKGIVIYQGHKYLLK